jgi:hypothetical protein
MKKLYSGVALPPKLLKAPRRVHGCLLEDMHVPGCYSCIIRHRPVQWQGGGLTRAKVMGVKGCVLLMLSVFPTNIGSTPMRRASW